ncbi:MAG: hypothetical protein FJ100_22765 [Deltaproteobacteria bacterium]|nr:hypothetical protein [Deltaproteobacteria bacterium]
MLEKMRLELAKQGVPVHFVAINKRDATAYATALTNRCSFAVLQDTDGVQAWDIQMFGHKDDFYIYVPDGTLLDHLPASGPRNTNLSTAEGYQLVKARLVQAATGVWAGDVPDGGSTADAAGRPDGGAMDASAVDSAADVTAGGG